MNFKYNILCGYVLVRSLPASVQRNKGVKYLFVGDAPYANPESAVALSKQNYVTSWGNVIKFPKSSLDYIAIFLT